MTESTQQPHDGTDVSVEAVTALLGDDGYLADYTQWTPEIAQALAALENVAYDDVQQTLVTLLRAFYQSFELSPTLKVFLNYVQKQQGYERYSSLQLMKDFPGRGSPMKRLCKIAGLPKPTNCF